MQLVNNVIQAIKTGEFSFSQICDMYDIPYSEVIDIYEYMLDMETEMCYDDSMDGDFDSAMASAGYGTDEDYGYFGD